MASWKMIDHKMIASMFPHVEFALSFPLISRTREFPYLKPAANVATTNLLFAVKNLHQWHLDNIAKNRSHYSLAARATKTKVISVIQDRGARIHRNTFKTASGELAQYWIVDYKDLIMDLWQWETLAASSFMQLPNKILLQNNSVSLYQEINLRNAVILFLLSIFMESLMLTMMVELNNR